jgi:hypothetical protein
MEIEIRRSGWGSPSPVPGQLARLCVRLGIDGHGITAPPAGDLPERWQDMLARRREPQAPAPGILTGTVAELPELDGAKIAIAGLHHGDRGTIMHLLATGVTLEAGWPYAIRPVPALWIRDSYGRWHATDTDGVVRPWGHHGANPWTDPAWSRCGSGSSPRWIAAPPGSRYPQPGDRLRSGLPCRSAHSNYHAKNRQWLPYAQSRCQP